MAHLRLESAPMRNAKVPRAQTPVATKTLMVRARSAAQRRTANVAPKTTDRRKNGPGPVFGQMSKSRLHVLHFIFFMNDSHEALSVKRRGTLSLSRCLGSDLNGTDLSMV